jgi:hypothetical protein
MKIPSTANADARSYVLKCAEFNGSPVSGRKIGHLYVVYSYGYWPMFVCDPRTDTWFRNAHRYSNTTSKQSSQCYPTGKDCAPVPTAELEEMLSMAGSADNPY